MVSYWKYMRVLIFSIGLQYLVYALYGYMCLIRHKEFNNPLNEPNTILYFPLAIIVGLICVYLFNIFFPQLEDK